METKLPKRLKKYFWDADQRRLNTKEYKTYVIERLLELGDEKAIKWLKRQFRRRDLKTVLARSRRISSKSRNFWEFTL